MLNKPGGFYKFPLNLGWDVPGDVDFISFTVNGLTPTLSEYIAYDTLSPPNPFIAVTQDGLGRVVYDGGFPKFYNTNMPSGGTPSPAFRYMINAINWCSKEGAPKRILALGTALVNDSYPIKGTSASGFATSLNYIAAQAGAQITIKDVADYGGVIDVTKEELATYSMVLFMDSAFTSEIRVTDRTVQNLIEFRESGCGLIFITDHGQDVVDVGQAYSGVYSGFFRSANRIISNFAAYFSGNVDRSPVNVGFIRRTYGDHILYSGLADSDNIAAGSSESSVVVTAYPKYRPNELPIIPLDKGSYHIQILARYYDGSIKIIRDNFTIDESVPIEYRKLLVRDSTASPFISNFTKGGWKIGYDGKFISMNPSNTKMWDEEKEAWVSVK